MSSATPSVAATLDALAVLTGRVPADLDPIVGKCSTPPKLKQPVPFGDGRAHDAFDLFTHLEHNGDVRRAVRAAAEALGLNQGAQYGTR